jgi:hypothetical protein
MIVNALITAAVLVAIVILVYGGHRLAIQLENRGYIYYREKPKGGGATAAILQDLDRLIRDDKNVAVARDNVEAKRSDEEGADDF